MKMHENEVEIDAALVRRLVRAQFPEWADLPVEPVPSAGTDNALFRLGDDRAIRMPRIDWAVAQVEKEQRWLPALAPHLPLAIPAPIAAGVPGEGYPWHWSVYRWLDGENATLDRIADRERMAADLARFIRALQRIDTTGGPLADPETFGRGVPLASRDAGTRAAIAALGARVNTEMVTAVWESALRAPAWEGPPVWVHGDLQSGNLLARAGRLHAVIDFGCLGVGDPACDLIVAWNLFTPEMREVFRAELGVDDATWERGRGWALSVALIALPYYWDTNFPLADMSRRTIWRILAARTAVPFTI